MKELKSLQANIRTILETAHSPRYKGQKSEIIAEANAALERVNLMLGDPFGDNPVLHFFHKVFGVTK